jgi:hypothetical protein
MTGLASAFAIAPALDRAIALARRGATSHDQLKAA